MKRLFFLLATLFLPICGWAQIDDKFASQADFEAFKQRINQRFEVFEDTINSRFAKELERQWTSFKVFKGEETPCKPRPQQLPQADTSQHKVSSEELPASEIIEPTHPAEIPVVQPKPEMVEPQLQEHVPEMMSVSPSFYRQSFSCTCPRSYGSVRMKGMDEKAVAAFWNALSCDGLATFVSQCHEQQQNMNLNDWGVFELVKSFARKLYPDQYAEQTVFTVFLMNQLQYKLRIGRVEEELVCLMPSYNKIYVLPYIAIDGVTYYIFHLSPQQLKEGQIFTYGFDFPQSYAFVDLNIYTPLRLQPQPVGYFYKTTLMGQQITIPVSQSVMDFYDSYPLSEMEIYANAHPEESWTRSITEVFEPILKGRSEYEKVAILLAYLHYGFNYAYDDDQFGREKYFFCEENFYYKDNDCEDRSILFAWLVKHLVGLDVVLLDYPDHIATAVRFTDKSVPGDYYMRNGLKYIVCDPTYIGADVGETMPQYKNEKAKIIVLRN
jgi:hypothetical protein